MIIIIMMHQKISCCYFRASILFPVNFVSDPIKTLGNYSAAFTYSLPEWLFYGRCLYFITEPFSTDFKNCTFIPKTHFGHRPFRWTTFFGRWTETSGMSRPCSIGAPPCKSPSQMTIWISDLVREMFFRRVPDEVVVLRKLAGFLPLISQSLPQASTRSGPAGRMESFIPVAPRPFSVVISPC